MQAFVRCAPRRWLELSIAILPLVSAFAASPLPAQGQPREGQNATPEKSVGSKADTVPVIAALTVEGGGTLGAYEAGMTWALVEIFRQRLMLSRDTVRGEHPRVRRLRSLHPIDFRAAAGASAGSINAFIAASRWCAKDSAETETASPFWQVWIPMGVSELLPRKTPLDWNEQRAVLTRGPFAPLFTDLDQMLGKSYYRPDCSVLFGAAITRLVEDSVLLTSNLSVRNQRYAAAFEVKGAPGGAPGLRYSRLDRGSPIPLGAVLRLPDSVGQKVIPYDVVHSLIKASSGFPLAFAPQLVSHCIPALQPLSSRDQGCPPATRFRRSYFVDGGVFDNGPLTIGYGLALMTMDRLALDSVYMLFLTPSRCRCPFPGERHRGDFPRKQNINREDTAVETRYDGADAFAKLLASAVPSARQYELQVMVRVLPTILDARREIEAMRAINDSLEGEVDRQIVRDSLEYEQLTRAWIAARTDVGSLQTLNDSLRNTLSGCRQPPGCVGPEDSSFAAPPKLQGEWFAPPPARIAVAPAPSSAPASSRRVDVSRLLISERWHRLAGDWLFGFGGFVGRPLREYDFYVGIYDALALVARRVIGADVTQFPEVLEALVMEPPIVMTPTARVVLRALYNVEFRDRGAPPLPLKDGSEQPSVSDSLFLAIIAAMRDTRDSLSVGRKCDGGPIERMGCSEGLDVAFTAIRTTPFLKRALRAANDDCAAANAGKERCSDDERFDDFVHEPYSALNRLTGKVLERLLDATPKSSALKIPLTVASATYFATNERARTGVDQGSVSIPPSLGTLNRTLLWLVPSSIGGYAGIPGWYYEWAARWHVSPGYAIGATTRFISASGLAGPASPRGRHTVPSLRIERKFGGAGSLLASTLGVDFSYWADWRYNWRHGGFRPTTLEEKALSAAVTSSLFAQKLRLSFGYRPTKYVTRTRSKSRVLFSIGVGDVTGLSYWLYRGLRQ